MYGEFKVKLLYKSNIETYTSLSTLLSIYGQKSIMEEETRMSGDTVLRGITP